NRQSRRKKAKFGGQADFANLIREEVRKSGGRSEAKLHRLMDNETLRTMLDVKEAQLQAELRKRPYGDAVFEALQRTVDEEEAVVVSTGGADGAAVAAAAVGKGEGGSSEKPGGLQGTGGSGESGSGAAGFLSTGDKVWKRGAAGSGDGSSGSDEKENRRLEGERVEAAARRTALWAVARGHREKLPDSVRVKWPDVLLSLRYQKNLLEAYREREKRESARASATGVAAAVGDMKSFTSFRKLKTDPVRNPKPAAGFSKPSKKRGDGTAAGGRKQGSHARGGGGGGGRGGARSGGNKSRRSDAADYSAEFIMPRDHFHGPTFHALLHEYRAEHLAAAREAQEEAEAAEDRKREDGKDEGTEKSRAATENIASGATGS
ncbi:unnamed protein product, partial [Pylaiella littoralis]